MACRSKVLAVEPVGTLWPTRTTTYDICMMTILQSASESLLEHQSLQFAIAYQIGSVDKSSAGATFGDMYLSPLESRAGLGIIPRRQLNRNDTLLAIRMATSRR